MFFATLTNQCVSDGRKIHIAKVRRYAHHTFNVNNVLRFMTDKKADYFFHEFDFMIQSISHAQKAKGITARSSLSILFTPRVLITGIKETGSGSIL